jgi:hypothetical protein
MLPEDNSLAVKVIILLDGYSCAIYRHPTITRDNIVLYWREAEHGTAAIR